MLLKRPNPAARGVVVIGVRGTNAPKGSSPTPSGHAWHTGGWGDQIVGISDHFMTVPPYNDGEWPTYIESINYPASGGIDEPDSVRAGSDQLVAELNYLNSCSVVPAIVIAGHSQGAEVVDEALSETLGLPTRIRNQIKAVALFGDPRWARGWLFDYQSPAGKAQGVFSMGFGMAQTLQDNYKYWGWDIGSSDPNPTTLSKIRSYCSAGDYFCQSNPTSQGMTIHNSYTGKMGAAAAWMSYRLAQPN